MRVQTYKFLGIWLSFTNKGEAFALQAEPLIRRWGNMGSVLKNRSFHFPWTGHTHLMCLTFPICKTELRMMCFASTALRDEGMVKSSPHSNRKYPLVELEHWIWAKTKDGNVVLLCLCSCSWMWWVWLLCSSFIDQNSDQKIIFLCDLWGTLLFFLCLFVWLSASEVKMLKIELTSFFFSQWKQLLCGLWVSLFGCVTWCWELCAP